MREKLTKSFINSTTHILIVVALDKNKVPNMIGYINTKRPNTLCVLLASTIRRSKYANYNNTSIFDINNTNLYLANLKDFEIMKLCPDGYLEDTKRYLFNRN